MKTTEEIEQEVRKILAESEYTPKEGLSPLRTRVEFLNQVKRYLETQPREEFVRKEIERLTAEIADLESKFFLPRDIKTTEATKLRKQFENRKGIPRMKTQLETLQYILA